MADNNPRIAGSQWSASDPATGAVAISYGGGNQSLSTWGRGVYISTAGNLAVVMIDGTAVTFTGLLAGTIYPIAIKQVTQAGSTAAGLVLL
jgi:hypothetical protein